MIYDETIFLKTSVDELRSRLRGDSFYEFMGLFKNESNPLGKLFSYMKEDKDFPKTAAYKFEILKEFYSKDAPAEVFQTMDIAWKLFEKVTRKK